MVGQGTFCGSVCKKAGGHYGRNGRQISIKCQQCGKTCMVSPSLKKRRFCSYKCHLDSGGAKRAGLAAAKARTMYGSRKDANHAEIVDAMRKAGLAVLDISKMGRGVPDLIVSIPPHAIGKTVLADIKNPKTRYGQKGLNGLQKKFADEWQGSPVYLVRTIEDVLNMAAGRLDLIDKHGGYQGEAKP
jgi:hypothetical protein